ncbi:hypothetical protein NDU88_006756 [Pleurodeles waltl]|uniref:Uncharacterized protein n=1 Tax=Pleurodeles waltl TaxID=8319 RepID=A0AAV7SQU9_PLEWA|nr:hypothetical protein NDU88_006756 [Pleurodeles waltl]
MQSSVGRQGLTSTKLGLKSHWTVGLSWTELLSSRDHARHAERGPRGPVMQSFCCLRLQGEDSVVPREISSELLVQEGGRLPPEHAPPGNSREGGRVSDTKLQSSLLLCCGFAGVLSSQRSILWQKVKREMQRNSGELFHSVSKEFPKAETLNSQKRRFGYLGRRIG